MDLLDFDTTTLYYEQATSQEVELLIEKASLDNFDAATEVYLKLAWLQAPKNLTVLVALYRYFFYKHRLEEALDVAEQAVSAAAELLGLPTQWRDTSAAFLDRKRTPKLMGLLRFYLQAIQSAAVLCLRLGRLHEAVERLRKLTELDTRDRLASTALLQLALSKLEDDPSKEHFHTH